ncbi:MAG: nucleoside 2-deoxyribosyltransferase [Candidatus Thorarchaeota archaeon]
MTNTERSWRDVYISGPLFTPAERTYLEQIDNLCNEMGLSTYLPHRDAGFGAAVDEQAEEYFCSDLAMLKKSRCVIAVINGSDIDSGTAWEIGFSYSAKKYLIGLREDVRDGEINPMIACSLRLTHSLEELHAALLKWKGE